MTTEENFRYPIGRYVDSEPNNASVHARHIQILREFPALLRKVVNGLDDSQLDTRYREGGWTLRQVVHHLADSHANSYIRIKLALAEDWPTVKPFNEAVWAELSDKALPVGVSLDLISALHARMVAQLEMLSEKEFMKGFYHPERGRITLAQQIAYYAWHSQHHTVQIASLRQRMGW